MIGVHKVKRKLVNGTFKEYHYTSRGGNLFWDSTSEVKKNSPEYLQAYHENQIKKSIDKFRDIILAFYVSPDFKNLSPRYQRDILGSVNHRDNGIDHNFGNVPLGAFNDVRARAQVKRWTDSINSDKVATDRMRHLQKIIKWAFEQGYIKQYHFTDMKARYRGGNRAEIYWLPEEIDAFESLAPKHVSRILIAACETGLRPSDLYRLSRFQIQKTSAGARIKLQSQKRKRLVSIPVTPRMQKLIDETPKEQSIFLVGQKGNPYQNANYLGDAVSSARDRIVSEYTSSGLPLPFRPDLRLYDARGAAATRLLKAGANMTQIATFMGWSLKKASETLEHYAAMHPDASDDLAMKIAQYESRTKL